jgi:hypothetical protein
VRWGSEAKEGEHFEVFAVDDDVAELCARQVDSGGCGKVSAEHRAKFLQAVGEHEETARCWQNSSANVRRFSDI